MSLVVQNTHECSSQQTAEQLRISKEFQNITEETTGNFTDTIISDCEDFFGRLASVEIAQIFAQILSTTDSNSLPRENHASIHPKSDCVGATNTVFFFPPYLHAQRMTSLHPVASV